MSIENKLIKSMKLVELDLSKLVTHPMNKKFFSENMQQNHRNQFGDAVSTIKELMDSIKISGII